MCRAQHIGAAGQIDVQIATLDDPDAIVRGAVAGSAPIWGRYSMFEFPNWAAKFFADAVMMDLADIAIPPVPSASKSFREDAVHV